MSKERTEFEGIVLAAGFSSRMKAWKPEIKIGDFPLIVSTIKPMLDQCKRIIIVGGFNFERLKKIILEEEYFSKFQKEKFTLVENENFRDGMFSSVKKGLLETENINGVFITPGDIPFVKSSTYSQMIKIFNSDQEHQVFIPVSKVESNFAVATDMERKGHPILIRRELISEIISNPDTMSLRFILDKFPFKFCPVNDQGIFLDIDDKKDIEKLKQIKLIK